MVSMYHARKIRVYNLLTATYYLNPVHMKIKRSGGSGWGGGMHLLWLLIYVFNYAVFIFYIWISIFCAYYRKYITNMCEGIN